MLIRRSVAQAAIRAARFVDDDAFDYIGVDLSSFLPSLPNNGADVLLDKAAAARAAPLLGAHSSSLSLPTSLVAPRGPAIGGGGGVGLYGGASYGAGGVASYGAGGVASYGAGGVASYGAGGAIPLSAGGGLYDVGRGVGYGTYSGAGAVHGSGAGVVVGTGGAADVLGGVSLRAVGSDGGGVVTAATAGGGSQPASFFSVAAASQPVVGSIAHNYYTQRQSVSAGARTAALAPLVAKPEASRPLSSVSQDGGASDASSVSAAVLGAEPLASRSEASALHSVPISPVKGSVRQVLGSFDAAVRADAVPMGASVGRGGPSDHGSSRPPKSRPAHRAAPQAVAAGAQVAKDRSSHLRKARSRRPRPAWMDGDSRSSAGAATASDAADDASSGSDGSDGDGGVDVRQRGGASGGAPRAAARYDDRLETAESSVVLPPIRRIVSSSAMVGRR